MPFEVMVIIIVSIVAATVSIIVKQALDHQKEMRGAKGAKGDVTTSELAKLVRAATEEATQPLLDRIDALEDRLEQAGQLPPSDTPRLLDDGDVVDERVEPTRRRVRP